MAKGKKTGGRNFTKGRVTNPKGRPVLAPEVKAIKRNFGEFLKSGVSDIFQRYLSMTIAEFRTWAEDNKQQMTMFERYVASCLMKAEKSGDLSLIERLMDRFLGKPKQAVDLSGQVSTATQFSNAQLAEMAREFIKRDDKA